MSEPQDIGPQAFIARYGRTITLAAAIVYTTTAFVFRVPETLAMFGLGLILVTPFMLRNRLFPAPPSILSDFVSALAAPLVVVLISPIGRVPLGRALAVSAGLSLAFSAWFAIRRAAGVYGSRAVGAR